MFLIIGVLPEASPDMTFVYQETTSTGGRTRGPSPLTTYITSTRMRTETSTSKITIIDLEKMKLFNLDSKTKKCYVENIRDLAAQTKSLPAALSQLEPKITVTNETSQIEGYKCTKIIVNVGIMKQTVWVSPKIKTDKVLFEFNKKQAELLKDVPFISSQNALWQQYQKMQSFPVKIVIETKTPHFTSRTESILKSYNYDKIDPALFEIPKGYTPLPKQPQPSLPFLSW